MSRSQREAEERGILILVPVIGVMVFLMLFVAPYVYDLYRASKAVSP